MKKNRYKAYLDDLNRDIMACLRKQEHTAQSLHQELGIMWRTAKKYLQTLQDEGVVSSKLIGRVRLYYLNPEHQA